MKKAISLALALCMALLLTATAFAATTPQQPAVKYEVTVGNAPINKYVLHKTSSGTQLEPNGTIPAGTKLQVVEEMTINGVQYGIYLDSEAESMAEQPPQQDSTPNTPPAQGEGGDRQAPPTRPDSGSAPSGPPPASCFRLADISSASEQSTTAAAQQATTAVAQTAAPAQAVPQTDGAVNTAETTTAAPAPDAVPEQAEATSVTETQEPEETEMVLLAQDAALQTEETEAAEETNAPEETPDTASADGSSDKVVAVCIGAVVVLALVAASFLVLRREQNAAPASETAEQADDETEPSEKEAEPSDDKTEQTDKPTEQLNEDTKSEETKEEAKEE